MKSIQISKTLRLTVDVVTQTLGIIGRKGSGKTYLSMLLAEGLLDMKAQVVILDPVGNWWSLRLAADGKRPGYKITVLGGDHGDVPLEPEAGELVADLVCGESLSVVLDVSLFSESGRKKFVTAFAKRLMVNKRRAPSPIHIILEEAQLFAPQRVDSRDAGMVGAIQQIVRLGRNYGIGSTMVSQRPQSINKEVLNQVECLFVLQLNGAHERKAIEQWWANNATETKSTIGDLPSLGVGWAMVWSPQWLKIFERHKILKKKSFDGSATPKMGARSIKPRRLVKKEIKSLEVAMAEVIEHAAANDPSKLKAEINRLNVLLNKKVNQKSGASAGAMDQAVRLARAQGFQEGVNDAREAGDKIGRQNNEDVKKAVKILESLRDQGPAPKPKFLSGKGKIYQPKIIDAQDGNPVKASPPADSNGHLRSGAVKMVKVLVSMSPRTVTRVQLATLAGFAPGGGTFGTYLSDIGRAGMLATDGPDYCATDLALSTYGHLERVPTDTKNLTEFWKKRLRRSAGVMPDILVDLMGEEMSKEELANHLGMTISGGTFNTYISDLVRNGLAVRCEGARIKASASMFAGI